MTTPETTRPAAAMAYCLAVALALQVLAMLAVLAGESWVHVGQLGFQPDVSVEGEDGVGQSQCERLRIALDGRSARCVEGDTGVEFGVARRADDPDGEQVLEAILGVDWKPRPTVHGPRLQSHWPESLGGSSGRWPPAQSAIMIGGCLVIAAFVFRPWRQGKRPAERTDLKRRAAQTLIGAAAGGLLVGIPMLVIATLGAPEGGVVDTLFPATGRMPEPLSPETVLVFVALLPLIEEKLFRERLITALAPRLGMPTSVVLSTVVFAAIHFDFSPAALIQLTGAGLVLGTLYARTGSLSACVACHATYNFIVVLLA